MWGCYAYYRLSLDEGIDRIGVPLSDTTEDRIELLIGSDIAGHLFTRKKLILNWLIKLIAIDTVVVWTLMGKESFTDVRSSLTMMTWSLLVRDSLITDLWELDIQGITDLSENKFCEDLSASATTI